jgi:hypothetical protein
MSVGIWCISIAVWFIPCVSMCGKTLLTCQVPVDFPNNPPSYSNSQQKHIPSEFQRVNPVDSVDLHPKHLAPATCDLEKPRHLLLWSDESEAFRLGYWEPMGTLTSEGHNTTYLWIKRGVNWQKRLAKMDIDPKKRDKNILIFATETGQRSNRKWIHGHGSPLGRGSGFQCLKPSSSFCLFKHHLNTGRHSQWEEWIWGEN